MARWATTASGERQVVQLNLNPAQQGQASGSFASVGLSTRNRVPIATPEQELTASGSFSSRSLSLDVPGAIPPLAKALTVTNPIVRTAGCLDHWNRSPGQGAQRVMAVQAVRNPGLVRAGMVFIMDHGGGLGHTGLVEKVEGGLMTTIEGNTDASRTREGGGVYRLTRKLVEVNKGFIAYGDG